MKRIFISILLFVFLLKGDAFMPTPAELLSIYTAQSQISNFFISKIGQIWVSAYGAEGDGVTDDTLAVQAAVDAAVATGVSEVNFVSGKTYKITALTGTDGLIFLGNNVTIIGGASITFSNLTTHMADNSAHGLISPQKTLANLMEDISAGTTVNIGCYGDSVLAGYDGSTYVTDTAPEILQLILNAYYGNSAAVVTNYAVQGTGTSGQIDTWEATIAANTDDIIFINYGINDHNGIAGNPAITADEYKENLRLMIKISRSYGKVVILITPNIVMPQGAQGTLAKAGGVKQFAEAMREVAKETSTPIVDIQYWSERWMQSGVDVQSLIPDGIHLSQAAYYYYALSMASVLINPNVPHIYGGEIIPSTSPAVKYSGATNTTLDTAGSRTGYGVLAQNIRFPVFIEKPGLDIYIATTVWQQGTTSCELKVDLTTVATVNFADADLPAPTNYVVDQEILLIENATPGFHLIEMNSAVGTNAGLYYVRAHPTRKKNQIASGTSAMTEKLTVIDNPVITMAGTGYQTLLTDIPTSRVIKAMNAEVTATFGTNQGFILFGHRIGPTAGKSPHAGLVIYLNASGYVTVAEGTTPGNYAATVLGNTNLAAVEHVYKVEVTTAGAVTVYVDGTSVGTYNLTKPHTGGFLGFWKSNAGSVSVKKVQLW